MTNSTAPPSGGTCTAGQRRRPLRQDGAQRHRVRPDGRIRWGLNILHHANVGSRTREADAETTPLRHPEHYQYDLDLPDIAEVWRRGSVIALLAAGSHRRRAARSPDLAGYAGRVSDSGEGRWTCGRDRRGGSDAGLQRGALQRFSSRGEADFADKLLSAMRYRVRRPHGERRSQRQRRMSMTVRPMRWSSSAPPATSPTSRSFPALQAMIRRGQLDVPDHRRGQAGWNLEQLRARARDSLEQARRRGRGGVRASCPALLRYVDGDYQDPATFDELAHGAG